jgi:hypothetical protein
MSGFFVFGLVRVAIPTAGAPLSPGFSGPFAITTRMFARASTNFGKLYTIGLIITLIRPIALQFVSQFDPILVNEARTPQGWAENPRPAKFL